MSPITRHSSSVTDPSHEEFWALKDVSFNIQQGDRVGIIGRNGPGKSTLLKIICGTRNFSSGRTQTNGLNVAWAGFLWLQKTRKRFYDVL